MTSASQLLEQIWQRPDDRQLLSVYADLLATTGETTRAEYMQLSLMPELSAAQEKRLGSLRKRHRGAWLGPARRFVWTWEESEETPGFVDRVQCSMANLVKGFELVRALGPRLRVNVTEPTAKRDVVALSKHPLGTLYGLELHEADAQWITDDLLVTLSASLRGLRSLTLYAGEARSSDRGWGALLPHLDGLEDLEVMMGENPERWLEMLLDSSLVRSLRRLSVPGWIPKTLRGRITKALRACELEFRDERRSPYNRATGYYESY
ncbi:MAG: hypothetical protein H0V17_01730 [Deltaproteobacteria bacterium]|nr:hypothetical protein [Deltaproteobacteria bacterium]